jgi:hypothetical protein
VHRTTSTTRDRKGQELRRKKEEFKKKSARSTDHISRGIMTNTYPAGGGLEFGQRGVGPKQWGGKHFLLLGFPSPHAFNFGIVVAGHTTLN